MSSQHLETIKGEISVKTENILPIIKKWLYSEHEIFLRELVSNAFDAIEKRKKIAEMEKQSGPNGVINIEIKAESKQLIIHDNGLGMTAEEIQKYINQIAFSGAEDFVSHYMNKDEKSQIIGHFGLGFYSAFMVSDKVEINTLSWKPQSKPALWSCDGSTQFTITDSDKKEIGTDIVLYINDENKQYLEEETIKNLIVKYANFLPVEIQVNGKKVNDQHPLWIKQPIDVKDEEYTEFYNKLFPFSEPPLFWIHLNVDYPFTLKGILFFPRLQHELDSAKGQVKLYCQQVFVSDNLKEVLPEFLNLLRGAIDCPDIPLNVSRSYLQNDPYVKKISNHIVKKVGDKLNELYNKDKASYEKYWEDIHPFIKYGMMTNDDFYQKVKDIVIYQSSLGYATSIPEYLERNEDKNSNIVLYSTDKETQSSTIALLIEHGQEVVYLNALIDAHFISFLESKDPTIKYQSVNAALSDHLVDTEKKSQIIDPADNKTVSDKLLDVFTQALKDKKVKIEVKNLKAENVSALMMESEQIKRLKAMTHMMQRGPQTLFEDLTLVVNSNNTIIDHIQTLSKISGNEDKVNRLCEEVYDLALLSHRPLNGEEIKKFISRTHELLSQTHKS